MRRILKAELIKLKKIQYYMGRNYTNASFGCIDIVHINGK